MPHHTHKEPLKAMRETIHTQRTADGEARERAVLPRALGEGHRALSCVGIPCQERIDEPHLRAVVISLHLLADNTESFARGAELGLQSRHQGAVVVAKNPERIVVHELETNAPEYASEWFDVCTIHMGQAPRG